MDWQPICTKAWLLLLSVVRVCCAQSTNKTWTIDMQSEKLRHVQLYTYFEVHEWIVKKYGALTKMCSYLWYCNGCATEISKELLSILLYGLLWLHIINVIVLLRTMKNSYQILIVEFSSTEFVFFVSLTEVILLTCLHIADNTTNFTRTYLKPTQSDNTVHKDLNYWPIE